MQTSRKSYRTFAVVALLLTLSFSALLTITRVSADDPGLSYEVHVSNIGWMDPVQENTIAGSVGSNQIEAIKLSANLGDDSSISYQTHVQDVGWMDWTHNDNISGTTGESKRLEALRIQLGGKISSTYDIYYRTYVQDNGWLGWASNGASSGSEGLAKPVQALQVTLVTKGDPAPGSTQNPFLTETQTTTMGASEYIEGRGWNSGALTDRVIGTIGESKHLEALTFDYQDGASSINYMVHLSETGWESDWHKNGEVSGAPGSNRQIEAVKITLSGPAAEQYDIYYQPHVQNYGWLAWHKNGEEAGTTGESLRLEALKVKLLPKGEASSAENISADAFRARIYGCWIDTERSDDSFNSYVSGISEAYIYLGNNQTFNGLEGYYDILSATTEGGWIRVVDNYTQQTHDIYLDFHGLPGNHLKVSESGNTRELVQGDTTDRIHYTFSGVKQYGQLAVLTLRKNP